MRPGKPVPRATVVLQSIDAEKRTADQYRHVYGANESGEYSITGIVP